MQQEFGEGSFHLELKKQLPNVDPKHTMTFEEVKCHYEVQGESS